MITNKYGPSGIDREDYFPNCWFMKQHQVEGADLPA